MKNECWLLEFKIRFLEEEIFQVFEKLPFYQGCSYSKEKNHLELKLYFSKFISEDIFKISVSKFLNKNYRKLFDSIKIIISNITEIDWLKNNAKLFQPVEYSDFVFYGDHIKNHLKFKKNMIRLNSSDAFGSGSHATTRGCINIFNYLQKFFIVEKFLDIGCGSGILSICAYKYWRPSKVLSVDIEKNSILRSKLNAKNNNLNNLLKFEHTNGNKVFNKSFYSKFDLIVANIISSELLKLAQDIAKYLDNNSYLVLSGILKSQENSIVSKFKNFKLLLVKKQYVENWVTILMIKKDKIH
ncbi:MAG: hypothetical protein CMN37_08890 [SAR116 cluster bacterium]|nr:hypothetical protein [SAR116 cluster bacterium]